MRIGMASPGAAAKFGSRGNRPRAGQGGADACRAALDAGRWTGCRAFRVLFGLTCLAVGVGLVAAATLDVSRLPPPASQVVDFSREIQPILERSCLRCHGPERPKSGFRIDTREGALQGGDNGVSLVVSNSAVSPLIHYVARLAEVDESLWMPPEGKAPLLDREEVARFRAWVDQGLTWEAAEPPAKRVLEIAPTVGGAAVRGNERVFQEHQWMPEGWNGGVETFEFRQQLDGRTVVVSEGHALLNDYRLTLDLNRRDRAFVRGGFEQFRKYYSDAGGSSGAFAPTGVWLDRDLHLDVGRAWLDAGLTLPDWPRLSLGYEHQYREGEKSLTSWSPMTQGGVTRNLFPTSKALDEETHILKFNLDYDFHGLRLEDDFRAEWSRLDTARTNAVLYPAGSDTLFLDQVREGQDSFQSANALRLERQFTSWFFGSGGYLYSRYDADASFSLDETYLSGTPGFARRWTSPRITLDRDAHVGNLNGQFGPWDGFTAAVGVQSDWSRQRGFGDASFDFEQAGGGFFLQPTTQFSETERTTLTEHVGLRYAKIPRTVLFADGRLQQESLDQFEDQPAGDHPLRRDTEAATDMLDFTGGFNTSPWRRFSCSSSYRWLQKQTGFDHVMDVVPSPFGDFPGDGYSAFIRDRKTQTDEFEARLVYHWTARLKTTFSYRLVASDYWTAVDPVTGYDPVTFDPIPGYLAPGTRLLAGDYDAHIYSLNAVVRPARKWTVNTTFSFHDTRTVSADNGSEVLVPYRGNIYSVLFTSAYPWNEKTDLQVRYGFSYADYRQEEALDRLSLGVEYQRHALTAGVRRRISELLSATLRYGFCLYDEFHSGGFNDYTAHSAFLTLTVRLP